MVSAGLQISRSLVQARVRPLAQRRQQSLTSRARVQYGMVDVAILAHLGRSGTGQTMATSPSARSQGKAWFDQGFFYVTNAGVCLVPGGTDGPCGKNRSGAPNGCQGTCLSMFCCVCPLCFAQVSENMSISGLVVEYMVAIDVTRVRFPADAYL